MDIKAYREERGLTARQMVDTMQTRYPQYGKPMQTAVENPERYGVGLTPDAEAYIKSVYGGAPCEGEKRPKKDGHKLKGRLTVRTTIKLQREIVKAISRLGYASVQDALTAIIKEWLEKHKEEDHNGNNA